MVSFTENHTAPILGVVNAILMGLFFLLFSASGLSALCAENSWGKSIGGIAVFFFMIGAFIAHFSFRSKDANETDLVISFGILFVGITLFGASLYLIY